MAEPVAIADSVPVGLVRVIKPLEAPTLLKSVPLPAWKDGRVSVGVLWTLSAVVAATPVGVTVTVWSTTTVLVETAMPQSPESAPEPEPVPLPDPELEPVPLRVPESEAEPESESGPALLPEPFPTPFSLPSPLPELPWLTPVGVAKALLASMTGVLAPPWLPLEPEPEPEPELVGVAKALLASKTGVPAPPALPFESEPEPVGTAPLPIPPTALPDSSGYTVIVIHVVEVEVTVDVDPSPLPDGAAVTWPSKSVGTEPEAVIVTV